MFRLIPNELTIAKLRELLPEWQWAAVRRRGSTGWDYEGKKGERRVHVYPCSVLDDPWTDDETSHTEWYVHEDSSKYVEEKFYFWCRDELAKVSGQNSGRIGQIPI